MDNDLRKRLIAERKNLDCETRKKLNECIFKNIISLKCFSEADNIFIYVNSPYEAETLSVIEYALKTGKKVFAPITANGTDMYFTGVKSLDGLKKGFMGILEPEGGEENVPSAGDLFIVPGSVFDIKGHRMGYGRGYYDRYLGRNRCVIKTALCYDFQLLESIPAEKHDIDMDIIVTDRRVVFVKGDGTDDIT